MQDVIVTGIAALAAFTIGWRLWGGRKAAEPKCSNCASNKPAKKDSDAPKPVLFYGSKR